MSDVEQNRYICEDEIRKELENFLKNLQPYQFEPGKQVKKRDIFNTNEGSGRSSYEESRENINKNKRVGINNG